MKSYISNQFEKNFVKIKTGYRPDLDVLRGIAILMVILFHFNPKEYRGGFLGVDVFFVISGFIITKVISERSYENALYFLSDFYSRRIKRILPALLAYILIISLALSLFVYEPFLYLKTGFFALFGFSNIFLATRSTQYFSESTDLNPFVQTWSLGIEEQFYFVYPLLCLFSGFALKKTRHFFSFLIIAISFFSLYLFIEAADLEKIYFLPQYRFWEIGLGCSLFLSTYSDPFKKLSFKFLAALKLVSVFAIILLSIFTTNDTILIVSVVFASLLYIAIHPSHLNLQTKPSIGLISNLSLFSFKLLCTFLRHLGILSYSLYLWHWGVKIFYDWYISYSSFRPIFLFVITYFVSLLSYLFIEKPFRSLKFLPIKTFFYSLLLLFGSALVLFGLRKNSVLFYTNQSFSIWGSTSKINPSNCNVSDPSIIGISNTIRKCSKTIPSSSTKDIFILGDSHSRHHLPLAEKLADKFGPTTNYFHVRCGNSPFPGLFEGSNNVSIDSQKCSEYLLEYLIDNVDKSDIIILSSRWLSNIYPGTYDLHTRKAFGISINQYPNKFYPKDVYSHLTDQLLTLTQGNKSNSRHNQPTLVFMSSIPDFPDYLAKPPSELLGYCESKRLFGSSINLSHLCYRHPSFIQRSIVAKREKFLAQLVKSSLGSMNNFIYFDQFSIVCPIEQKFCSTHSPDGTPLFTDDDHLSLEASQKIANSLYNTIKSRLELK